MEDPKTFSAPLTSFNDGSVATDKESTQPVQDPKSSLDLPDGDTDKNQVTEPSKPDGPDQGVKSEAEVKEISEGHGDRKSLEENQNNGEHKADDRSSDNIEVVAKSADLEANVSASSHTSDTDQKKEDQAEDPNIVDWDGPDDPTNPMNWPAWKVKTQIFLVSAITFIR